MGTKNGYLFIDWLLTTVNFSYKSMYINGPKKIIKYEWLTSSQESTKASASFSNGVSGQSGSFLSWDCNCLHTSRKSSILGPRPLRSSFMPQTWKTCHEHWSNIHKLSLLPVISTQAIKPVIMHALIFDIFVQLGSGLNWVPGTEETMLTMCTPQHLLCFYKNNHFVG